MVEYARYSNTANNCVPSTERKAATNVFVKKYETYCIKPEEVHFAKPEEAYFVKPEEAYFVKRRNFFCFASDVF